MNIVLSILFTFPNSLNRAKQIVQLFLLLFLILLLFQELLLLSRLRSFLARGEHLLLYLLNKLLLLSTSFIFQSECLILQNKFNPLERD